MALSLAEFNRMVDDHGPSLYRLAYRLIGDRQDAEDMLQETFRSAWSSRQTFRTDGGGRAWLATILRRRVVDWRRKPSPPLVYSGEQGLEIELNDANPIEEQYTDEMQRALNCLPNDLRETLLLVVVGELTHQEAADSLGVPLGTVLSRVSRARKRLRELLMGDDGADEEKPPTTGNGSKLRNTKDESNMPRIRPSEP